MAQSIDTFVAGDIGSCRSTAAWLNSVSGGVHEIGTSLHRARADSESCWSGQAGDAFRNVMKVNGTDADELAEQVTVVKKALEKFADELDTVKRRIDQAREVAASKGLTVTPTTIEGPGPAPRNPARNGPGYRSMPAEKRAEIEGVDAAHLAEHEAKVRAFQDAQMAVDAARRDEKAAHATLASSMKIHKTFLETLSPSSWTSQVSLAASTYSASHTAANALAARAREEKALAEASRQLLKDPNLPQAERTKALASFLQSSANESAATRAAGSNARIDKVIPGPGWAKSAVGYSFKGVGITGAAMSALSAYEAIKAGKDPGRVVTTTGAQIATGTAIGALGSALAAGGYVSGAVATGGVLVAGTVVTAGVGYVVDHHYDDIKDGVHDAGKRLEEINPKMTR
ncbi:putative T7SS-secreted protein [Saccharopolyspora sp. NPDC002686]|uniref:putative T7SS-secreted protein n=1 Tax=Saccharopolyspora sp. NPDC002686 TaxID=3154541 RepID=UPI00332A8D07